MSDAIFRVRKPMDSGQRSSASLYDYSDKSVQQAGYTAVGFAVINLFTGVLAWIRYALYHTPGKGSVLDDGFADQQYLINTPRSTAVAVGSSVVIALISGALAFGIFRRSRAAIVAMVVFVVLPQLYIWLVARSFAGSLVSIVVTAFLVRGARRMFLDHAEQNESEVQAAKQ